MAHHKSIRGSSVEIEREVQRVLGRTEGKSAEYESGLRYGQEASREEWASYGRKTVRETLDQLEAYARSGGGDFVQGQVAGYRDTLAGLNRWSTGDAQAGRVSFASPGTSTGSKEVRVDTSFYRGYHGAGPRGRGDWAFMIGKVKYELSDDPALYRPASARGVSELPYGKAREYAVAEARRRGASVVGLAP
jgi:hypothetical protein